MNLTISLCNHCPCMGEDTEPGVAYCGLSSVLGDEQCVLYGGEDNENQNVDYEYLVPPDWCRLRSEALRLSLELDESKIEELRLKIEAEKREKISKRKNEQIYSEHCQMSPEWEQMTDSIIDNILNEHINEPEN